MIQIISKKMFNEEFKKCIYYEKKNERKKQERHKERCLYGNYNGTET